MTAETPLLTSGRAVEVDTPVGAARATLYRPSGPVRGRLLLGHGAGGGSDAVAHDLLVAASSAVAQGWVAVLVDQPWKVAGRRVAVAPPRLDEAWVAVVGHLRDAVPETADGPPLVVGGRSAGARVACRTAAATGASAVLCLAFPLVPAGRPEKSRAAELPQDLPTLVVQGERDRFGGPADVAAVVRSNVAVAGVRGDHSLRADDAGLRAAVRAFLDASAK
ncbi:alpha/beta family hydrolase [uncultured Pseudokineococcus sp.]|uniref:alpha/beta hydrolase family protein n=1 Tax=uncultured Pseudokineococcus sp. TaxID=1642928 RepID=UPI00263520FB|nr:alpha/beta family hydrolase [uncultured Pseudokineococcus sp.]